MKFKLIHYIILIFVAIAMTLVAVVFFKEPHNSTVALSPSVSVTPKSTTGFCQKFSDCSTGQACEANRCMVPASVHTYNHASLSVRNVRVLAFYVIPNDREVFPEWKSRVQNLMARSINFHKKEFNDLSQVAFEIYPTPVRAPETVAAIRAMANPYAHLCGKAIDTKGPSSGTLTLYAVFADWGKDDVADGGCDYFSCKSSKETPISSCNGSGGYYWGNFFGTGDFSCGMLTEENWKRIEAPGLSSTIYHEVFGHGTEMPHSDSGNKKDVMDVGPAYCAEVEDAFIDQKIKEGLID